MHFRLQHANSIQVSLVSIYPQAIAEMAPMFQLASAGFSRSPSGSEFVTSNFLALEVPKLPC
jgi:hypothetical protein